MQMATKQTGYQHVTGSDRWVRTAVWMQLMGVDEETIQSVENLKIDIDKIARLDFEIFLGFLRLRYDNYKDSPAVEDFKTKHWMLEFQSDELEITEDSKKIVDEWERHVTSAIKFGTSWDIITKYWYSKIYNEIDEGIPTNIGGKVKFFNKMILKAKICDRNLPRNRHHIPVSTLETNCPKCGKEKQKT